MRSVSLLRLALEAEVLRLRYLLQRQGRRAALGLFAAIFGVSALVLANVVGWQATPAGSNRFTQPSYCLASILSLR